MTYLFLAILSSASIALIFKYSEMKEANRLVVTIFNYLAASVMSMIALFQQSFFTLDLDKEMVWIVIGLGLITGTFYLLSFLLYQVSIKSAGASLSGMFGKLGILVPMILSMILWQEIPSIIQGIGIFIALFAIVLINIDLKNIKKMAINKSLVLLFFIGGLSEFCNKIFQKYSLPEYKALFLFVVFFSAMLISVICYSRSKIKRNASISYFDITIGILVGIPNLLSAYFLIDALEVIPASIAFPMYSIMTIVTILILSRLIYKEALQGKELLCIALSLLSIFLIA